MLCRCSLHLCPILACASCKFRGSLEDRGRFLCLRPIHFLSPLSLQLGDTAVLELISAVSGFRRGNTLYKLSSFSQGH